MPTIEEHAKNIPKAEKRRRIFILDVAQDHLIIFFYRLMSIAVGVVHVQVCFIFFLYYHISFLPARVVAPCGGPGWWPRVVAPGGGQFKEVVFVLQVTHVLYEWKITTAHPILTNKFKSI